MKKIFSVLVVIMLAGCSEPIASKPKTEKKAENKGGVVDDVLLQRSKLEAHKKVQDQLQKINADREEQMREALGE
ncbi:MAG: hypothetical protein EOM20_10195 [Spartobacteria bacterium]|nr:hypothetical protein [Spartobacteria bacterium]